MYFRIPAAFVPGKVSLELEIHPEDCLMVFVSDLSASIRLMETYNLSSGFSEQPEKDHYESANCIRKPSVRPILLPGERK